VRRVVITGAGNLCPIGNDWQTVRESLRTDTSGIQLMPQWQQIDGLLCHLGAPVDFELPARYKRRVRRSMGRVAQLAVFATELAIADAGLTNAPVLTGGRTGVAYGSATGSTEASLESLSILLENSTAKLKSTSYLRAMAHTAAVNIGVYFGLTGRVITTSSACTAASQAIGYGYETIRAGLQDIVLAGGADELSATHCSVFDSLLATSQKNATPKLTPRPFDKQRDGLVLGEGANTLVLEALDHAQARGASILGEVIGFGTNADGAHITRPNPLTQAKCLELALADAGVVPGDIDFVSAHGTATGHGDIAESVATEQVLGFVPISSIKGHIGHTLAACGGIEAWATLNMMREGWFAPTLNLTDVDPECARLDYLMDRGRKLDAQLVMSNNFAFGGINTSLIFRRLE